MSTSGSILGNAVVRLEDPDLLTGAGKYVDDLDVPGTAHVSLRALVVRPCLVGVGRCRAAASMPGVLATYSGDDLGLEPFLLFPMMPPALARPVFAKDRVRFVGDVVAAVVAETRQQAIDAAEAVVVECEALPVVLTASDGLASDAPLLFPEHGSNICFGTKFGEDVDALEGADVVAEVTMVSQRLLGAPMENNGALAVPGEPDGGITLWVSHQAPHSARDALAPALGLAPEQLRVVCPWVGGGFGPKAAVYVEYLVAAAAARALGRPSSGWPPGRRTCCRWSTGATT